MHAMYYGIQHLGLTPLYLRATKSVTCLGKFKKILSSRMLVISFYPKRKLAAKTFPEIPCNAGEGTLTFRVVYRRKWIERQILIGQAPSHSICRICRCFMDSLCSSVKKYVFQTKLCFSNYVYRVQKWPGGRQPCGPLEGLQLFHEPNGKL